MAHRQKLSLWSAVLVTFNIMFGTGVFINTFTLSKYAGFLGFLSYLIILIFIAPLIVAIMALLRRYPDGGFYTYAAQDLSKGAGFLSAWAYFTGKLASCSLLVHVFSSLIQTIVPAFQIIPVLALDCIVLALFTLLNTLAMSTGRNIMYVFLVLKLSPILFAILSCLYLYNHWSIPPETLIWSGIPATLPLVLFAFAGFEACCAISNSIENPEKNAPRAIFIAFSTVVTITILYQFFYFLTVGPELMMQKDFMGIVPSLINVLIPHNPLLASHIISIMYIAFATAALGGAYGIMFSGHWNLYFLAKNGHTFFQNALLRMNKYRIPSLGVLFQGLLAISYILISRGDVVPLQQISVLGVSIAFTASVLGLISAYRSGKNIFLPHYVPWLAVGSCAVFISTIIRNFIMQGTFSLLIFSAIQIFGLTMYFITKKK